MEPSTIATLVTVCGWLQLTLCVGVLSLPKILGWRQDVAKLRPLNREIFLVYAVYTWFAILSFGLVSGFAGHWILADSPLATAVTIMMALFWGVRLLIQFTVFDRSDIPKGAFYRVAEVALVGVFLLLTTTYAWAAISNVMRVMS